MKSPPAITKITEAARSVQLLQIDGFSATATMTQTDYIGTTWNVDGYQWEVRVYPEHYHGRSSWVALKLILVSSPRTVVGVRVCFTGQLVDPSGVLEPSEESCTNMCHVFHSRKEQTKTMLLEKRHEIASGYLENDSLTVECAVTVLRELPEEVVFPAPAKEEEVSVPLPMPSSDLHLHLGELLESQKGADVTFVLPSGERFPAHKSVLAARSPVFMAEFFGGMEERNSQVVEVHDVEPTAFEAMLRFVYTDVPLPELDGDDDDDDETLPSVVVTMAQHLLAAADRYGLNRLKVICEAKLAGFIEVGTAATTLALAEQHGCSVLKAKCVDFVTASAETLDAVLATDGYKHLAASCPLVLAELLKSARGKKN